MLHAAAHAKSPVPARAASNLKVFTDALDELRELQEATPTPIPAEEGHAGPSVGSMAWFLLEVLVCCSVPFDLRLAAMAFWRAPQSYVIVATPSTDAVDATPSTRRHRRDTQARTGYEHYLRHESVDGADRWRNVRELANLAAPYAAGELVEFLDTLALVQDQDMASDDTEEKAPPKGATYDGPRAKGPGIPDRDHRGCEEGLLPHYYATADKDGEELAQAVDEERRLLVVDDAGQGVAGFDAG